MYLLRADGTNPVHLAGTHVLVGLDREHVMAGAGRPDELRPLACPTWRIRAGGIHRYLSC
jgi:hypothetical protein